MLVDCANVDGDMRLSETVACVNMAHMGRPPAALTVLVDCANADGDVRLWGRSMCECTYGPAALPVLVYYVNAHLCGKV